MDDGNCLVKFREVQTSWETNAEEPVPVQLSPVSVHPSKKEPVAKLYRYTSNLYRYTTNLYRYTHVRIARIEQELDSNERARSSFNYQCGITMEKGIKAKGEKEKGAFDS